jgi:hypothetical protein
VLSSAAAVTGVEILNRHINDLRSCIDLVDART